MYQALYRKYRPTNFDEVTGQEIIKKTLQNAILNNKISHAYLFTGPRGTGKTSIAKILAKTVNCVCLQGYMPCNKCVNCTQIDNKQSNDIIEIDAASNNGIDEIREIRNKASLVPTTGKYKVYIIDEVHMLTTGAFNALLKTLEEPPSHVIFILATTEPHKIPATILSRCQRFDFKRIANIDLVERLKYIIKQEKIDIEDDAINEIARLSDGGMRDSISLLDQALAYSPQNISLEDIHEINGSLPIEKLSNFVSLILEKNIEKLLNLIDDFNDSGKNLIKISEEIINYLKNILLYKISPNYLKNVINNYQIYEEAAKNISKELIIELISKFNMSMNDIKLSSDPKLSMELLIIKECSDLEELKQNRIYNNELKVDKLTNVKSEEKTEEKSDNEKVLLNQKKNIFEDKIVNKTIEIKDEIDQNSKLMEEFKKNRINNALAKFDKNLLINLRRSLYKVEDYLLDENYSIFASMIIDGELKATSDEYLVFVFKTENLSLEFNKNIVTVQELFEKIFNKLYKVISTDDISWEIIKKDFNNKSVVFEYIEEQQDLEKRISMNNYKNEVKELDNIFGDIVEYN